MSPIPQASIVQRVANSPTVAMLEAVTNGCLITEFVNNVPIVIFRYSEPPHK